MWVRFLILSLFSGTLLLLKTHETRAHMNFFITEEEVLRLLGINTELYYVHKGIVNDYAINFVVMIPSYIDTILFSWQSLLNYSLPYTLNVKYGAGHKGALLAPQMNISSSGLIPTSVETFSIQLVCTGLKNAEIGVQIHLFVSTHSKRNATIVKFRRNKICLKVVEYEKAKTTSLPNSVKGKRDSRNVFLVTSNPVLGIGNGQNDSIRLNPGYFGSRVDFSVACAVAVIALALLAVITSAYYIKKKNREEEHVYMTALYDSNPHMFLRPGLGRPPSVESGSYATIDDLYKNPPSPAPYATSEGCRYSGLDNYRVSYYASSQVMLISQITMSDPRLVDPAKRLQSLAASRATITLEKIIEEGIFGQVYSGKYREHQVTIKTTKETASRRLLKLFLAEGTMMFGMDHKNVLTILCVNLDNPKQPLLVYPYARKGNLKRFLIKYRQNKEKGIALSTQNLVDIAIQILLGLMYLHSKNICYKDVATRNAVVFDNVHIKITDNCLSRDLFPNDYFCMGDRESKPVKWMALESLLYNQYSTASDIWGFGVVLWELTTLAQQPFADVDPFEMATFLRNGCRLDQPVGCPDELFGVMTYCWLNNPSERPQLNQLLAYLNNFYTALCRFV